MDGENPFAGLQDIGSFVLASDLPPASQYQDSTPSSPSAPDARRRSRRNSIAENDTTKTGGKLKRKKTIAPSSGKRKARPQTMSDESQEMDTEQRPSGASGAPSAEPDPFKRMQEFMEKQFAQTNENISKMNSSLGKLNDRVNINCRNLNRMKETVEANALTTKADLQNLNSMFEKRDKERKDDIEELRNALKSGTAATTEPRNWKEDEYWAARKKARVWPIKGNTTAEMWRSLGDFFLQEMRIPSTSLAEKDIMSVTRVPGKSSLSARRTPSEHDEVVVTFSSVQIRDMACSYSRNLFDHRSDQGAPTAGVRKELPEYLIGVNRALLHHGAILRRQHGNSLRRNIKFDDSELSLYMDVCLPGDNNWLRVDFDMAMQERRSDRKIDSDRVRKRLASDTLRKPPSPPRAPTPPTVDLTEPPTASAASGWGGGK